MDDFLLSIDVNHQSSIDNCQCEGLGIDWIGWASGIARLLGMWYKTSSEMEVRRFSKS